MTNSSPALDSASDRFIVSVQADRMRYAQLVVDEGPEIFEGSEIDLLTAICHRELREQGVHLGRLHGATGRPFAEVQTPRGYGLEDVYEVVLQGENGTAVVRLRVLAEEHHIYFGLEGGGLREAAESLLKFEVNDDSLDVNVAERDGRLDLSAVSRGSYELRWAARDVEPSLTAIAAAVVSFN